MKPFLLAILAVSQLSAQAVNAASGSPFIAPGSIVSIYGHFQVATGSASKVPLPTSIPGNGVFYVVPSLPAAAANYLPLFYWSPDQINLQLPNSVGPGQHTLYAEWLTGSGVNGGSGYLITVEAQAPGIFVVSDGQYRVINSSNPAVPGQELVVWLTGLGVTPTAPAASLSNGATVRVDYAGHTGMPGLDQVNIGLPSAAQLGCTGTGITVNLTLKSIVTGIASNVVSLPISCK